MVLLPGRADPTVLAALIGAIADLSPFRFMTTRSGGRLAAAMTSAGACGWVSDRRGYRYETLDPETGRAWPDMPLALRRLAVEAAAEAGFARFAPDACLINRYAVGAGMGLHQDRDEAELSEPVVSVSLGLPAVFLIGGVDRKMRAAPLPVRSGDVVVFGGPARLLFHGIRPVKAGVDPLFGPFRYNLTFRKAR
jgi:alkylated DNA repair protein (DNA oxidative demethylase)